MSHFAQNPQTAQRRYAQCRQMAGRYAWWLGQRSHILRQVLRVFGWRLSQWGNRFFRRPRGALSWPTGLAYLCLNAPDAFARQAAPWVAQGLKDLMNGEGKTTLPIHAVDQGGLAYAALRLFELESDPRYLTFAQSFADTLCHYPEARQGMLPYTQGKTLVLVDTVAFICPCLARLARLTHHADYAALALRQLEAMWHYGRAEVGWVYHAFDATTHATLGIAGWGRGVGWLLMGVVDTLCELPESEEKARWLARGQQLLAKLTACQRADGHWSWHLDDADAAPDSSVTALIAYALARWQQAGFPQSACQAPMLALARAAIDAATDQQGRVGQCSGEAKGIGDYSAEFGNFMWAQAPAAASDLILGEIRG
jgi:unsaturated rhamnogalacturonyl hydrolase